jgi:hypothetical protein
MADSWAECETVLALTIEAVLALSTVQHAR